MCTLIVARNVFPGYPLVVAANRDELLDRPSQLPGLRDSKWRIFAPTDLQRGGTWIGVNGYGVFVGLTNRLDVKSEPGRMSRGELVMFALRHYSAKEAFADLQNLVGNSVNGFHMVIADKNDCFLLKGNGNAIECTTEQDGLLIVTNHGVGRAAGESVPTRVHNVAQRWQIGRMAEQEPSVSILTPLLDIHGDWRYGTCISEPEDNYGTKSSSVILLKNDPVGDIWQYFHRERTSPDRHVCTDPFDDEIHLSIAQRS